MPHFLSWVVISGLMMALLASDGPANHLLSLLGMDKISFLTDRRYFRSILVGSTIWKETGWSTIVYLAAIASIPKQLYGHQRGEQVAETIYIYPDIVYCNYLIHTQGHQ